METKTTATTSYNTPLIGTAAAAAAAAHLLFERERVGDPGVLDLAARGGVLLGLLSLLAVVLGHLNRTQKKTHDRSSIALVGSGCCSWLVGPLDCSRCAACILELLPPVVVAVLPDPRGTVVLLHTAGDSI